MWHWHDVLCPRANGGWVSAGHDSAERTVEACLNHQNFAITIGKPAADTVAPSALPTAPAALRVWQALKRVLCEPLLHFLLLGIVLFAAYSSMERGRGGAESSKQIQLTLDDLRQLDLYLESQWRRPPTPQELKRLVESKVQEEVRG